MVLAASQVPAVRGGGATGYWRPVKKKERGEGKKDRKDESELCDISRGKVCKFYLFFPPRTDLVFDDAS